MQTNGHISKGLAARLIADEIDHATPGGFHIPRRSNTGWAILAALVVIAIVVASVVLR